jgi:hypothetical protein
MGRPPRRASGGAPLGEPPEEWTPGDDDPLWRELQVACRVPFGPIHRRAIQDAVNDYYFARQLEQNTGTLAAKIRSTRAISDGLKRAIRAWTPRGTTADAGLVDELVAELEARVRQRLGKPRSVRLGHLLVTFAQLSDEIVRELKAERAEAPTQTSAWDQFVAMLAELVGAFVGEPQKLTSPRVVALVAALHGALDLGKRFGDEESAKKALADTARRYRE